MDIEFTARQVRVSKQLRNEATSEMDRVIELLGKVTAASITFRAERHLQIVEILLITSHQRIVAHGEADTQQSALRSAIERLLHQTQRHKDRTRTIKRKPRADATSPVAKTARARRSSESTDDQAAPPIATPVRRKARTAITVHSFPGKPKVVEPHILAASEAVALRPMTIEEAVKETEFRDRDLLIFRNATGDQFVLHRRRDGQMELVEIPS